MYIMGSYIGRHEHIDEGIYALLSRDIQGYYLPSLWLEPDLQTAMALFKHAVFTFGLKLADYDKLKAIYLYDSNERIAKCFFPSEDRLVVSFAEEDLALLFDRVDEQLPPGKRTTAWNERKFAYHFGAVGNDAVERHWLNLGRNQYNT